MTKELIEAFERQWGRQRPDLNAGTAATAVRLQVVARLLDDTASAAVSDEGLERWEYDVLSALRRSGAPFELTASALAHANMLSSGAMTNRLDRLETRRLIRRRRDTADRRRVVVRLTAAGKRRADRAANARFDAAERTLKVLSNAQRRELDRLLGKLIP